MGWERDGGVRWCWVLQVMLVVLAVNLVLSGGPEGQRGRSRAGGPRRAGGGGKPAAGGGAGRARRGGRYLDPAAVLAAGPSAELAGAYRQGKARLADAGERPRLCLWPPQTLPPALSPIACAPRCATVEHTSAHRSCCLCRRAVGIAPGVRPAHSAAGDAGAAGAVRQPGRADPGGAAGRRVAGRRAAVPVVPGDIRLRLPGRVAGRAAQGQGGESRLTATIPVG